MGGAKGRLPAFERLREFEGRCLVKRCILSICVANVTSNLTDINRPITDLFQMRREEPTIIPSISDEKRRANYNPMNYHASENLGHPVQ